MTGALEITEAIVKTPIGPVKIDVTDVGIRRITLDSAYNDSLCDKRVCSVEILSTNGAQSAMCDEVIQWLRSFFDVSCRQLPPLPPIDNSIITGSNFTSNVLRTLLREIGSGAVVSYAELARSCGSPKACRAVGQAMRINPIPLVVPCHRVVGSNGKLGNYMSGKGNNIKAWLLKLEEKRKLG